VRKGGKKVESISPEPFRPRKSAGEREGKKKDAVVSCQRKIGEKKEKDRGGRSGPLVLLLSDNAITSVHHEKEVGLPNICVGAGGARKKRDRAGGVPRLMGV